MKNRFLIATLICFAGMLCAVSFAHAAVQCSIVPSSIPWNQSDQTTWKSGTYQLTIECTDNGFPVPGYQAEFSIFIMEGAAWQNKIATLTDYSTPTDSDGIAYINVPLIHVRKNDGDYIHISPFDNIKYTGGGSLSSQAAPANSSRVAPLNSAAPDCTNTNTVPGCCTTTITVTCCDPIRVISYITVPANGQCITGTKHPDSCTTIDTTWDPTGIYNTCTRICMPQTVIALSSFTAIPGSGSVTLNWTTETEMDNAGFNLYRAESENGEYVKINDAIIPSKSGAIGGASYQFIDSTAKNRKTYYYKLEDMDLNGTATQHEPQSVTPRWFYSFWK